MKVGIWIDKSIAYVIKIITNTEFEIEEVQSPIEDFHVHGGSGTKFKGGPQDVVHDSKYLHRKENQYKLYFKQIKEHIKGAESIVVFGPAEAGGKLYKEMANSHLFKDSALLGPEKTDNMTKNQLKQWVKNYFKIEKVD